MHLYKNKEKRKKTNQFKIQFTTESKKNYLTFSDFCICTEIRLDTVSLLRHCLSGDSAYN